AKILVDRGEAYIGHLVQRRERLHHELADHGGRNLVFAHAFEPAHDAGDHPLDAFGFDGSLAERVLNGALQFLAVEGFAAAGLLDHCQLAQLHALEGRKAAAASGTEAPAPDRSVVVRGPAILDLGVVMSAERATHVKCLSLNPSTDKSGICDTMR